MTNGRDQGAQFDAVDKLEQIWEKTENYRTVPVQKNISQD